MKASDIEPGQVIDGWEVVDIESVYGFVRRGLVTEIAPRHLYLTVEKNGEVGVVFTPFDEDVEVSRD